MSITVQQNPSWQLSLAQLSPSLLDLTFKSTSLNFSHFCCMVKYCKSANKLKKIIAFVKLHFFDEIFDIKNSITHSRIQNAAVISVAIKY